MTVHTQTTPAEAPGGSPARSRGILAVAAPAPEGWELGGIQVSVQCPTPVIRDKCITLGEPDVAGRPTTAAFPAFLIEQGSGCSTLSGGDRSAQAREALSASTDYALGLTLLTGEANGGDAPSLSDADDLGEFSGVLAAVAALETAAAAGVAYVLHATPAAAVHLASAGLIDDLGRSPSGAAWIVSNGYIGDGELRIWATGRVWAGVSSIDVSEQVSRRTNNREAWAARSAIVGFNPCVNLSATFTPASTGGGGVDPETLERITTLETDVAGVQGDVTALQGDLAGKADVGHTHDAADVTSGALAAARIPSLSIGKTTGLQTALDGKVESVVAGDGVAVDAADPANPVVSVAPAAE